MWSYQSHFQTSARVSARTVFESLDPALDPQVILVGIWTNDDSTRPPLCVDPEDGDILLDELEGLEHHMAEAISADPEAAMFQSHPLAEERRVTRVERRAFSEGVARVLAVHRPDRAFFASSPHTIEDHLVTCVLHFDREVLDAHPTLHQNQYLHRFTVPTSLIGATVEEFLLKCYDELSRANPGEWPRSAPAPDLLRRAGRSLMTNPGCRLSWGSQNDDLYDQIDAISALRYEGAEGVGRLLLTDKDHTGVVPKLTLQKPVPLRSGRSARKLVEMATANLDLLATPDNGIYGLGTADPGYDVAEERVFEVVFLKGNAWELRHDRVPLMRVIGGVPELPADPIQREDFEALAHRVLGQPTALDLDALWSAIEVARRQRHGTLVVVSTGAEAEAARLSAQSTLIEPVVLLPDLVRAVSSIDGAILVDPTGVCHAVGVILDGLATKGGDPGRGARFNSAHRYVTTALKSFGHSTLAVVVSEDGMVNLLPALRPQLDAVLLRQHLAELQRHRGNPHVSRTLFVRTEAWLRKHAFYLDAEQCEEVNVAVSEIRQAWHEAEPSAVRLLGWELHPHPDFDSSYLFDSEEG